MSKALSFLRSRLAELQIAIMLLSRLPAGRLPDPVPGMALSAWAWPLVGALVGAISAITYGGGTLLGLPPVIAAPLALVAGAFATGAMHEDGLADLADGCGGGADRARKLDIMRDSRIGTYGVLAVILSVGLRAGAMIDLAAPDVVLPAIIALSVGSRATLPLWLAVLPAARADGLGRAATDANPVRVGVAIVLGAAALVMCLGALGGAVAIGLLLGGAVVARIAYSQLGGQTGDVLGAVQQIAEIGGWLVLVALL